MCEADLPDYAALIRPTGWIDFSTVRRFNMQALTKRVPAPFLPFFILMAMSSVTSSAAENAASQASGSGNASARIPVILDTDIGDDIDDTWALAMVLKCPELDLKLVVGDQRKSLYRAKLIAKFLERAGRTDIPVGVGLGPEKGKGRQSK
jgi:hypothetical protein